MQHDFGVWLDLFPDALIPGQSALDIGCGSGDDTLDLLAIGLLVTAIDLKRANIQRAASRTSAATFCIADLRTGLPFHAGSFGIVVASLSLHYFDRVTTDHILRDIHRVLRPSATLLTRVNTVGDTASLWGVGIEHEQDYFEVEPGTFKRFFTEDSLHDALRPYFQITTLNPQPTYVMGRHLKQTIVVRATRRDT